MCNVKFFGLLLGLVCSRNAATIKKEDSPAQANLGDLMGLFGGLMTAMAPKEEAEEIQKQMGQMSELLGGIGLIPTGAESPSAADSETPIVTQQHGCCNELEISVPVTQADLRNAVNGIYSYVESYRGNPAYKLSSNANKREVYLFYHKDHWIADFDLGQQQSGLYTAFGIMRFQGTYSCPEAVGNRWLSGISGLVEPEITVKCKMDNPADDNSEYLKVSSTGQASFNQSDTMGLYVLQETRVNSFPVWKRQGDGEDQYLFVSTDGYWGIGPDLNTTDAGLYLPQNDPTPKSPINAQGWLYVVDVDQDWDIDDTINVEVFTGGYEINSFGGAAEQYPNLIGRYRLTSTIINDFPVYEMEKNGKLVMVIFLWTQMDFGQPVKILIQILERCTVMMTLIIFLGAHLQKVGYFGMMMLTSGSPIQLSLSSLSEIFNILLLFLTL